MSTAMLFHKCVLYNKSNGNCKVVPDNINVEMSQCNILKQ